MLDHAAVTPVSIALDVLEKLVAFPTVSSETNLPLIDYVEEVLRPTGARLTRVPDETGAKTNLLASFGPSAPGGVVLSGHCDVVPVAGQPWSSDPFRLTPHGDTVVGRGTTDMKGFVAACIAALSRIRADTLSRPIHLCISYDEEVGCLGVPSLVDRLVADEPLPDYAIIGEPSEMRIVTSHKSAAVLTTTFGGHAAHSSQSHLGVNAGLAAARFMAELDRRFTALRADAQAKAADGPPSNLMPPFATFNVGAMSSGTAHNIIPHEAKVDWQYRMMPDEDVEMIAQAMDAFVNDTLIPSLSRPEHPLTVRTVQTAAVPPLNPAGNRAAREAVMALGPYDGDDGVAYGTEAGFFQAAGIPSVVCGPGTIEVAHQPDESLPVSQLAAATGLVDRVIQSARG